MHVKEQKNDRRDAEHILKRLTKDFPRLWMPTPANQEVGQLMLHRLGMRLRVINQLQAIAMNEGVRRKPWYNVARPSKQQLAHGGIIASERESLFQEMDGN